MSSSKNVGKTREVGNHAVSVSYQLDHQRWLPASNGTWSWARGASVMSGSERGQAHTPLARFIIFESAGLRRSAQRRRGAFCLAL